METAVGRRHAPGKRVILTVGTDCAIGKMSVALELRAGGARPPAIAPRSSPTGQTGMMIEGWGVAVDRVISDFVQGTVEWLVEEGEARGDWVIVEGQGSLDHPAYSSVTLGAHPRRDAARDGHGPQAGPRRARLRPPARGLRSRSRRCRPFIALHEPVAGLVAPSKVVAVALNTSLYRGRRRGAPGHRRDRRRDRPAGRRSRSASAPTGCGRRSASGVDALPWVERPA